jgi:hypothetical protein
MTGMAGDHERRDPVEIPSTSPGTQPVIISLAKSCPDTSAVKGAGCPLRGTPPADGGADGRACKDRARPFSVPGILLPRNTSAPTGGRDRPALQFA